VPLEILVPPKIYRVLQLKKVWDIFTAVIIANPFAEMICHGM